VKSTDDRQTSKGISSHLRPIDEYVVHRSPRQHELERLKLIESEELGRDVIPTWIHIELELSDWAGLKRPDDGAIETPESGPSAAAKVHTVPDRSWDGVETKIDQVGHDDGIQKGSYFFVSWTSV
jgi:hypothetical protein